MKPWKDVAALPRPIWILFAVSVVNRMGTMVLPFLVLYCTRDLGFTPTTAAFSLTLFGVASIVSAGVGGRLIDRIGALKVAQGSLACTGVVLLCLPLFRSPVGVFTMIAIWSLVGEVYRPASLVVVSEAVAPRDRKSAVAVIRLAINAGMSVGPALGGFLASVSFLWMFVIDGVTSLLAAGILFATHRAFANPAHRTIRDQAFASQEESRSDAGGEAVGFTPATAQMLTTEPLGQPRADHHIGPAWKDGIFLRFLLGMVLVSTVFFQIDGPMPLHVVENLGFAMTFFGLLFTLNTVLIVALEIPLVSYTARMSSANVLAIGAALFGVGFGGMAFATSEWAIVATVVVWTFGEMFFFPASAAFVSGISPPGRHGEYMGLYTMCFGIGLTIGPWAGAIVMSRFGSTALWISTFLLALIAAALVRLLPENRGRLSAVTPVS
jgi:predicted MFS family arabinose efflux permease